MPTWEEAAAHYRGKDVTTVARRLGAESMTKACYSSDAHPEWVFLVASTVKEDVLKAEVAQLLEMRDAGVPVPGIGSRPSIDDTMIPCTLGAVPAIGFLEQKFAEPFTETKVKEDTEGNWFYESVVQELKRPENAENAEAWQGVSEALDHIIEFQEASVDGVPDLQVTFEAPSLKLYVFDPGDPKGWGNTKQTDLRALPKMEDRT